MNRNRKPIAVAVTLALAGLAVSLSQPLLAQTPPATTSSVKAAEDAAKADEAKKAEALKKAAEARKTEQVETVVVTGIRASIEKSLDVKLNAGANVEVITAEDVGKMPDKNLADSLQRLVGVAVRTDYDEAEKVSLRGTNPDMSLVLFNGHTVSGGDWYVSDQLSSSRSTSLSLIPSSALNQAVVYKTSQANIADGGLAGTINVTTRKPLDESKSFGGVISAGGVYATLPGKTSSALNANLNWKSEDKTLGMIGQVFKEKRFIRRDSVSRFAYGTSSGWGEINTTTMKGITDASLAGTGLKASDLNGVRLPGSLSSEFIEGVRDRQGGLYSIQYRPNDTWDVTVTSFYSTMDTNNYGRLTSGAIYSMLLGKNDTLGGTGAGAANTSSGGQQVFARILNPVIVDQVTNYGHTLRVLKSATIAFAPGTSPQYVGNSEGFYRDGANANSGFFDVDAKYRVNSDLVFKALFSTTQGEGITALDQGATFARYGTGITYALNGLRKAPDVSYAGAGTNQPGLNADGSGYRLISRGASSVMTIDKEQSLAVDGEYTIGSSIFSSLLFGLRYADHERLLKRWAPSFRTSAAAIITNNSGFANYPGDFGSQLGGGNWDRTGFYLTSGALKEYISSQIKETSPEFERRVAGEIDIQEKQSAVYLMQNLEGDRWSGNAGLRFVKTEVLANIVVPVRAKLCPKIEPGKTATPCVAVPGAINTAGDGTTYYDGVPFDPLQGNVFYKTATDRSFNDLLPSLNLRYELRPKLIARLGLNRTIGRQNYNVLGAGFGTPTCSGTVGCTVTGPNPNLKPLNANNADLSLAWYFAPRSVALVNLYKSTISGYVKTGPNNQGETIDLVDPVDNVTKPFFILTSSQQGAKIEGIELSYEQPVGKGFGFNANVSRARTRVDDGRPMTGVSEVSGNVGGFFENDTFSARLVYNYRGKYVASSTAPAPTANSQANSVINGITMPLALQWAAPVSNVAFSMNYSITPELKISFDATNLTNPTRAIYRYSEEEQQKLDVSGRQYYLTLRYQL